MNTQKNIGATFALGIFFLGVAGLMAYTTWHAVFNATGDTTMAWLSLFIFDAGAYAGYQMLVGNARGAEQRFAANAVLWIDFALAAGMVGGALELLPDNAIKYVVWASAAFNLLALYYYKTHSPETLEQMQIQDEDDAKVSAARRNRQTLFRESMRQADVNIMRQARGLGVLMALRAQADLKYQMQLPMTEDERKAFEEDVIDVQALPAPVDYEPIQNPSKLNTLVEAFKAFFTQGQRTTLRATPSKQEAPSPSEEPDKEQNPQQDNQNP